MDSPESTYCSSGVECPHCHFVHEDDGGFFSRDGEEGGTHECAQCGKSFRYSASFYIDFTAEAV